MRPFTVHGVIHYCVANMPGAVARTSTFALNNATLAYGVKIADMGIQAAAAADRILAKGINTYKGKVTHKAVAAAVNFTERNDADAAHLGEVEWRMLTREIPRHGTHLCQHGRE